MGRSIAARSRARSVMGSDRGSPMRERRPTTAIAMAVIAIGIAHHTSADTVILPANGTAPRSAANSSLEGTTASGNPPPRDAFGHSRVKPPGRVADVRLPLAHIHPLSRGLRPADRRESSRASSNRFHEIAIAAVDEAEDSLGTTGELGVDGRCIGVCTR